MMAKQKPNKLWRCIDCLEDFPDTPVCRARCFGHIGQTIHPGPAYWAAEPTWTDQCGRTFKRYRPQD